MPAFIELKDFYGTAYSAYGADAFAFDEDFARGQDLACVDLEEAGGVEDNGSGCGLCRCG